MSFSHDATTPALHESETVETPTGDRISLDEIAAGEHPSAAENARPETQGIRSARLVAVDGRVAMIAWRGSTQSVEAEIAPEVDDELMALALENRDSVMVEMTEDGRPMVVGLLQTRLPRKVHVSAEEIQLSAARKVVLRAGKAVLKLHEDGEIEVLGSKINAVSRGLFRIVGRVLRLN